MCSVVVESLPGAHKTLGATSSTEKKKKKAYSFYKGNSQGRFKNHSIRVQSA